MRCNSKCCGLATFGEHAVRSKSDLEPGETHKSSDERKPSGSSNSGPSEPLVIKEGLSIPVHLMPAEHTGQFTIDAGAKRFTPIVELDWIPSCM